MVSLIIAIAIIITPSYFFTIPFIITFTIIYVLSSKDEAKVCHDTHLADINVFKINSM